MESSWKNIIYVNLGHQKSEFSQFWTHQTPIFFESFLPPAPPKKIGIYDRFWRTLTMVRFRKSLKTHYFDKIFEVPGIIQKVLQYDRGP